MTTTPDTAIGAGPVQTESANGKGTIFDNPDKRQTFARQLLELANPFDGTKVKTQRFEKKDKGKVRETLFRFDYPEGERYYINVDGNGVLTEISYASREKVPESYSVVFDGEALKVGIRKKVKKDRALPIFHEIDGGEFPKEAGLKIDLFVNSLEDRLKSSQTRRRISAGTAAALSVATATIIPGIGSLVYMLDKSQPKPEGRLPHERESGQSSLASPSERIRKIEEETEGESSFAAQNMRGESIEVNGDKLFEAWDLINLPVSILALKKFQTEGGSYDIYQTINDLLKYHKNELLPKLVQYFTGKSDKFESYEEIVGRLQIDLGMLNTSYNPALGIYFRSTANDMMKAMKYLFDGKLAPKNRDFLVNTLIFQPDEDSRLGYLRKQQDLPIQFQTSFHLTGDGRSGNNGNSHHDMGGFITTDGRIVLFVSLNQKQGESMDPVNRFETESLSTALESLLKRNS